MFIYCIIKVNVIHNQKYVLGAKIFSTLLSKIVDTMLEKLQTVTIIISELPRKTFPLTVKPRNSS